eukprot:4599779-Pyramimonas_sp.AAC.1
MVMIEEGIVKGTSIHRKPEPDRRDNTVLSKLKGLPWNVRPKEREVMAAPMPIEVPAVAAPASAAPPAPVAPKDVAKALYVKRADIDKFGMWPGCK